MVLVSTLVAQNAHAAAGNAYGKVCVAITIQVCCDKRLNVPFNFVEAETRSRILKTVGAEIAEDAAAVAESEHVHPSVIVVINEFQLAGHKTFQGKRSKVRRTVESDLNFVGVDDD